MNIHPDNSGFEEDGENNHGFEIEESDEEILMDLLVRWQDYHRQFDSIYCTISSLFKISNNSQFTAVSTSGLKLIEEAIAAYCNVPPSLLEWYRLDNLMGMKGLVLSPGYGIPCVKVSNLDDLIDVINAINEADE